MTESTEFSVNSEIFFLFKNLNYFDLFSLFLILKFKIRLNRVNINLNCYVINSQLLLCNSNDRLIKIEQQKTICLVVNWWNGLYNSVMCKIN